MTRFLTPTLLLLFSFLLSSHAAPLAHDGYSCSSNRPRFPEKSFSSQPDSSKVYLKVSRTQTGTTIHEEAGLVKFASVFGIRVLGDEGVEDEKVAYVATLLAELLDMEEKGSPSNSNLVKSMRKSHSMIVLVSDKKRLRMLKIRQYRPKELKCFRRAFHVATADAVMTDSSREEKCPEDDGKKDRARGLVGDFLVSKGYPATYPADEQIGVHMKKLFERAESEGWINTRASNCRSRSCAEIAFQSWALSSVLGSDKCWCQMVREWKFCTPQEMRIGFPELWGTLTQELMLDGVMQPNAIYNSPAVLR